MRFLKERDKLGMPKVKTFDARKHSEKYALVIQRS
jgi:hypothetical protein